MKHNYVGIDVSAKAFTTTIDHEGKRTEAFDLPNDPKGFRCEPRRRRGLSNAQQSVARLYLVTIIVLSES